MKASKPNWPEIRLSYLNGEGSLQALSNRFGVPLRSLERHCSRENWRLHADRVGGNVAAIAGELAAVHAQRLSLPERSAKLRERVVAELEVDVRQVGETPPKCLADSQARQDVLRGVVNNAEVALSWGDKTPAPSVRIHIMGSTRVQVEEPASLPASPAFPVLDIDGQTGA